jgi:hypothetical protein
VADHGVTAEDLDDWVHVAIEVEHRSGERRRLFGPQLDHLAAFAGAHAAPVGAPCHLLDAGHGARREELDHSARSRASTACQSLSVSDITCAPPRIGPGLSRGSRSARSPPRPGSFG